MLYKAGDWLRPGESLSAAEPNITSTIPGITLGKHFISLEDIAFYNIIGCANGSFLIGMNFTNDIEYTYFNYVPPTTERGTPVLFTHLHWSDEFEVSIKNGIIHLSIPMRANEFEDYRFRLEADINENGEYWTIGNREFAMLDLTDIKTNVNVQNIIKKVPIQIRERVKYSSSYQNNYWFPNAGTSDDTKIAALRVAAYGGDSFAILRLYALAVEQDVGADINALQIASSKLTANKEQVNVTVWDYFK